MYLDVNDSPLHQMTADWIRERIIAGGNPLDFFIDSWAAGYPLLGHYQPLPQFILALLRLATFGLVSTPSLYHLLVMVLLVGYPFSFFFALRRFGLTVRAALAGAIISVVVHSTSGFGHELASYLSLGSGLYTQLFGMLIFPWAIVLWFEYLSGARRGRLGPLLVMAALLLSHVFLAYFALLIIGFFWLIGVLGARLAAMRRLALLGILLCLTASFFIVPMMINAPYHGFSRYEPLAKLNSYGLAWVLQRLFLGDLLDGKGLPLITLLAILGFAAAARRRGQEGVLAAGFLLSLLLFAGRTTWGAFLDLLPSAKDLHFERFLLGVHFFGAALAGLGVAWILKLGTTRRRRIIVGLGLVIAGIIVFRQPCHYLRQNADFTRSLKMEYARDEETITRLTEALRQMPVSRVYAGPRGGWGSTFKVGGAPMYLALGKMGFPEIGHLPFGWSLAGDFSLQLNPFRHELLDLYAVSHLVSWRDDRYWGITPVYHDDPYAVYWVSPGSYFSLVQTPLLLKADKYTYWNIVADWQTSAWPKAGKFIRLDFLGDQPEDQYDQVIRMRDLLHYIYLEKENGLLVEQGDRAVYDSPDLWGLDGQAPPPGNRLLDQQRVSDQCYQATVDLAQPAVLLLKMTYHPFWRATLDGLPVRPFMVSPGFLALDVPQGRHEISFTYRPPWWKTGLFLLLLIIPVFTFLWDRKNRGRGFASPPATMAFKWRNVALLIGCFTLAAMAYSRMDRMVRIEDLPPVGEIVTPPSNEVPQRITIGGIPFDHGVVTKFGQDAVMLNLYRLDGRFRTFEAWVGLRDSNRACNGLATFTVYVDGQMQYQGQPQSAGSLPEYIKVDIEKRNLLVLQTRFDGSTACAEAAWAEAGLRP